MLKWYSETLKLQLMGSAKQALGALLVVERDTHLIATC
jgi:hypothetical protein